MTRRFRPPWTAEQILGGYVVKDATGQALAYVYARETKADADIAKVLTMDEARTGGEQHRQAANAAIAGSLRLALFAVGCAADIGAKAMPQKEAKTRAELEALLIEELKKHPECSNVEGVAITRPVGRPWDVAVLRDGPGIRIECRQKIYEITNRLVAQYNLVPD